MFNSKICYRSTKKDNQFTVLFKKDVFVFIEITNAERMTRKIIGQ